MNEADKLLSLRPLAFTCRNYLYDGQSEEVTAILAPNKILPARGGGVLLVFRCSLGLNCDFKRCLYSRELISREPISRE